MTKFTGRILFLFCCVFCVTPHVMADSPMTAHKDIEFTEFFRRTNGWVAGDGGVSIPLSEGAVLWLFGDSHVNDFDPASGTVPCLFQVRNAALLQQTNIIKQTDTLVSGSPTGSFIRIGTDEKFWFWPSAGFQSGGTIYIYATKYQRAGKPGKFDFKAVGRYWAKIERSDLADPTLGKNGSYPVVFSKLQNFKGIEFNCGFSPEADGCTYAFGTKWNKKETNSNIYVARFLTIRPEGLWTFWDGQRWTAAVTRAAVIGHGASTSLNVAKIKDKWLSVSSALSVRCDMGKTIYASTSSSLTGPFTAPQKIYEIDDTVQGHSPFFYLPWIHPEFINGDNEVLVTYSINGYEPCVPDCDAGRMNPDFYRVKAFRLPLATVGIH